MTSITRMATHRHTGSIDSFYRVYPTLQMQNRNLCAQFVEGVALKPRFMVTKAVNILLKKWP